MLKISISKRKLANIGFLIYVCGGFSNSGIIIASTIIVFFILSVSTIKIKRLSKYTIYQFLFSLLVCASYFWGHKVESLNNIGLGAALIVLSVFYCSYYIDSNIRKQEDIISHLKLIIWAGIYHLATMILTIPSSKIIDYSVWDDYGFNKNTAGLVFAVVSLIIIFLNSEHFTNKKIYKFILHIFVFFVVISSSRKALLAFAIIVYLYYILKAKNEKLVQRSFGAIVCIIVVSIAVIKIPYLNELIGSKLLNLISSFSGTINQENDYSIWERSFFRQYAMQMSFETPTLFFIGHGLNAFQVRMYEIGYSLVTYSHCNYTELLCNYGLLGFLFYYYYKIRTIFKELYKKNKNHLQLFVLILLAVCIVLEYGYVSYYFVFIQVLYVLCYKTLLLNKMQK